MSEEKNMWVRVYTGSDFKASLLQAELEQQGITVRLRSDTEAGLHSGFGASGFAQVLVLVDDLKKARELTAAFEEKMK